MFYRKILFQAFYNKIAHLIQHAICFFVIEICENCFYHFISVLSFLDISQNRHATESICFCFYFS